MVSWDSVSPRGVRQQSHGRCRIGAVGSDRKPDSPRGGAQSTHSMPADASRTSPAGELLCHDLSPMGLTGVSSGRLLSGSPVTSSFPGTLGAEYVEL